MNPARVKGIKMYEKHLEEFRKWQTMTNEQRHFHPDWMSDASLWANGVIRWFDAENLSKTHRGPCTRVFAELRKFEISPAIIRPDGRLEYWILGEPLNWRIGPAEVDFDGTKYYTNRNNELHRGADLPAVVGSDRKVYYKHGLKHRDGDKPAYIGTDGYIEYAKFGYLHRDTYQPAVYHPNGDVEWWWWGVQYWPFDIYIEEEVTCA